MHANGGRAASPLAAFMLFAAALSAAGLLAVPARAEQDDDAERVPSSAADVYSPIARAFTRQPALPGGPITRVPQVDAELPAAEGPVLLDGLKQRLQYADPFFRDTVVNLYGRTHYLDRQQFRRLHLAGVGRGLGAGGPVRIFRQLASTRGGGGLVATGIRSRRRGRHAAAHQRPSGGELGCGRQRALAARGPGHRARAPDWSRRPTSIRRTTA